MTNNSTYVGIVFNRKVYSEYSDYDILQMMNAFNIAPFS